MPWGNIPSNWCSLNPIRLCHSLDPSNSSSFWHSNICQLRSKSLKSIPPIFIHYLQILLCQALSLFTLPSMLDWSIFTMNFMIGLQWAMIKSINFKSAFSLHLFKLKNILLSGSNCSKIFWPAISKIEGNYPEYFIGFHQFKSILRNASANFQ